MLNLYTFCVFINRHTKNDLIKCLHLMNNSLNKNIQNYNLIVYTNLELSSEKLPNCTIRKYYDNTPNEIYNCKWLNLSFNKINIWKDLYDETKKNFTWIDLDTIVTFDISYINDYGNVFLENGGNKTHPEKQFKNNGYTLPYNRSIQGNFWKINIELYTSFMTLFDELQRKNMVLLYDLQSLFGYYFYNTLNGNLTGINILGYTVKTNTINSLCVWSDGGGTHCTLNGLNNLERNNNILKSRFYKNKEIHILSCTFNTLKKIWNNKKFVTLFS